MTRRPDTKIKPALLESIIEYLLDKPLSSLTFRGLAAALGVSTTVFVYHFGTRRQLVRDIIGAIAARQRGYETVPELALTPESFDVDAYVAGLRLAFAHSLLPRNIALQRLEFEAQMLETLEPDHQAMREAHQSLQDVERSALILLGMEPAAAEDEARFLVDAFYGIQIGLVLNGDAERAQSAFDRTMRAHLGLLGVS